MYKRQLQAIAEQSRIVRLPLNQVGSVNKINREINKFEQEFERKPSVDEMADRVDLSEDKIEDAMKASSTSRHLSVDAPFSDDEEGSMLDLMANSDDPTDNELLAESLRAEIERLLNICISRNQCPCFSIGRSINLAAICNIEFAIQRYCTLVSVTT